MQAAALGDVAAFSAALTRRLMPDQKPVSRRVLRRQAPAANGYNDALCPLPFSQNPETLLKTLAGLPQFASRLEPLWPLWRDLLVASVHALRRRQGQNCEVAGAEVAVADDTALACGELAWMAGLVFSDLNGADDVRRQGAELLNRQVLERTDRSGLPQAELLARLPAWFASLVRAGQAAAAFQAPLWSRPAEVRFAALVHQLTQLAGAGGELPLCEEAPGDIRPLLEAARESLSIARANRVAPPGKNGKPSRNGKSRNGVHPSAMNGYAQDLPGTAHATPPDQALGSPAFTSDESCLACLRSDWDPQSDRLTVAWHGATPLIELSALGRILMRGPWDLEIAIDHQPVPGRGEWSCVCWNSDSDADYLELQCVVGGVFRIERQILLSRGEGFAILADSIVEAEGTSISYKAQLPIAAGVQLRPDSSTRECRMLRPKQVARLFPLGLPQDRVASTAGGFVARGDLLELNQSAAGTSLYAPILIDWAPHRRQAAADWRTLTVTEEGSVVASDRAAGHRLRIGKQQWLIYHSLKKSPEARAVLGHNTRFETVIGSFDSDGEVTPILLIE